MLLIAKLAALHCIFVCSFAPKPLLWAGGPGTFAHLPLDVQALTVSPVVRPVPCLTCTSRAAGGAGLAILAFIAPPSASACGAAVGGFLWSPLGVCLRPAAAQGGFPFARLRLHLTRRTACLSYCGSLHFTFVFPAQVRILILMSDDNSEEDTRMAEISACRWPILALSEQAPSSPASGPYADARGALDPPIRTIEVNVRINERSICFFDITSGHTIQDLLDASEDPGCASVATCFRVTHVTVHTTAIALGCAERPPDFITPPSSDDEA